MMRMTLTKLSLCQVSMLDAALFDSLDAIARATKKDNRPFGGIQILLCGDFLQLPPVGLDR